MNIKRILSIILIMILLATILSGCGNPTSISGKDGIIGEGKKSPFDSRTEAAKMLKFYQNAVEEQNRH